MIQTIDQTTIDAAKESVTRAVAKFQADRAALFTYDGKPINAPDLHTREMDRITEPLTAAVDRAVTTADRVTAYVEALRVQPYADSTAALSAADLDDANRRRVFVAEDCATMPLDDLAERMRWVMGNAPKSTQWLYARYAKVRWTAEESKTPQDANLAAFGALLREHGVIGPAAGLSRDAVALGDAAGRLKAWARGQLQTASGNGTGRKIAI